MRVEFTPEALADLEAAVDYLEERSPAAADSLVRRVFDIADLLAAGDIAGPERLLDGGVVVRSWPVAPYRLYYQVDAGRLLILRVYHHARRPL